MGKKNEHRSMNLGPEAEEATTEAAKELVNEDKRIVGYIKSKFSDRLDHEGIDIMIFITGGLTLPIQIKSSHRRAHSFKTKHPLIKYVLFIRKKPLLDKSSPYYRSTLEYIKRKMVQFVTRAIRDAIVVFPENKTQP